MRTIGIMVCLVGCLSGCESRPPFDPLAHRAAFRQAGVSLEGLEDPMDTGDGRLFTLFTVPKEGSFRGKAQSIASGLLKRVEARGLPRDPGTWRTGARPHTAADLGKLLSYKSQAFPADGGVDAFELSIAAVMLARYHGLTAEVAWSPKTQVALDAFPPIVAVLRGPDGASHVESWGQKVPGLDGLQVMNPVELLGLHATRRARAALLREELALARKHVQVALEHAPHMAVTHLWSAEVLEFAERLDEALASVRKALETRDTPFVRFMLARLLRRTGDPKAAGVEIKRVLQVKPKWDEALREQGLWLCASGRGAESQRVLRALSDANPLMWRAHRDAAFVSMALRDFEAVRTLLKRGRRSNPKEVTWDVLSQGIRARTTPETWPRSLVYRLEPFEACAPEAPAPSAP